MRQCAAAKVACPAAREAQADYAAQVGKAGLVAPAVKAASAVPPPKVAQKAKAARVVHAPQSKVKTSPKVPHHHLLRTSNS